MNEIKSISADLGDAVLMSNDPNLFTDKIQIHECGRVYKTRYTRKFVERKKWEAPNPAEVRSIIPGSVTEVLVKPGDKVKKGSRLMIYEAMKMKNVIVSPFDAVVESVEVKAGDKLPKGALLVILK
ncbi:MAG: acetyl-CoA carboxylase biotin carboxyl carrier protein subunit [Bacteroidales bacterium]|nr:acetyl-CoA carboxylase biotin carboxyl carrier protein subunit [Bacteroidales bacterium]